MTSDSWWTEIQPEPVPGQPETTTAELDARDARQDELMPMASGSEQAHPVLHKQPTGEKEAQVAGG